MRRTTSAAHSAILDRQLSDPTFKRMATTLSVIAFLDGQIVGAHTGDTRVAIARKDGVKKLTVDQSEGQRLFAAGKLTKEEFAEYPRQHILEGALGAAEQPTIDGIEFDIEPGDKIILTSDGVHGIIFLREIRESLASKNEPEEVVEKLKAIIDDRGAKDNFSGAVVFVDPQES